MAPVATICAAICSTRPGSCPSTSPATMLMPYCVVSRSVPCRAMPWEISWASTPASSDALPARAISPVLTYTTPPRRLNALMAPSWTTWNRHGSCRSSVCATICCPSCSTYRSSAASLTRRTCRFTSASSWRPSCHSSSRETRLKSPALTPVVAHPASDGPRTSRKARRKGQRGEKRGGIGLYGRWWKTPPSLQTPCRLALLADTVRLRRTPDGQREHRPEARRVHPEAGGHHVGGQLCLLQ